MAILELERRFMGNKTYITFDQYRIKGKSMEIHDQQPMMILLHPHTEEI